MVPSRVLASTLLLLFPACESGVSDDDVIVIGDDDTTDNDDDAWVDDDSTPDDDSNSDDDSTPDDDATSDDDTAPPPVEPPAEFAETATGVLILVLDTIRADHIGCTDKKGLVPTVEAFFDAGSCFDRAKSNSAWTTPGTAAILSGTHGQTHGIIEQSDDFLNKDILLAPEIFSDAGYLNAQASANHAATKAGIKGRFENDYNLDYETELDDRVVDIHLVDRIEAFFEDHVPTPDTKFLLHVQFYSPHFPLCPQDPTLPTIYGDYDFCSPDDVDVIGSEILDGNEELLDVSMQLYAEDVAQSDDAIQALLRVMQEKGLLETTLVVFVGDHAEGFDEHGHWGHSLGLTFDQVDVPLGFWGPGIPRGVKLAASVSGVDVLPTLLDYVGLAIPEQVEGRSLRPLMEDPEGSPLTRTFQMLGEEDGGLEYAVTSNGFDGTAWTLINTPDENFLYHTEEDPAELENQVDDPDRASVQAWLQEMLDGSLLRWDEWESVYGGE